MGLLSREYDNCNYNLQGFAESWQHCFTPQSDRSHKLSYTVISELYAFHIEDSEQCCKGSAKLCIQYVIL